MENKKNIKEIWRETKPIFLAVKICQFLEKMNGNINSHKQRNKEEEEEKNFKRFDYYGHLIFDEFIGLLPTEDQLVVFNFFLKLHPNPGYNLLKKIRLWKNKEEIKNLLSKNVQKTIQDIFEKSRLYNDLDLKKIVFDCLEDFDTDTFSAAFLADKFRICINDNDWKVFTQSISDRFGINYWEELTKSIVLLMIGNLTDNKELKKFVEQHKYTINNRKI